jgi:hypothetical protein
MVGHGLGVYDGKRALILREHYMVSSQRALHLGTNRLLAWTIWDGNPVLLSSNIG